ncbi:MAG: type II secretion system secretin GspD [Planctomycetes bacterium]|nr:type II secretion system secretin GspD [Planctomycetota bacterium]
MLLKNLKTNEERIQKLLKIFLCFIYVFCLNFTGCESDSAPVTIQSGQENIIPPNDDFLSEDIFVRQIDHLNKMNTNLAVKSKPVNLTPFTAIQTSENINADSGYSARLAIDVEENALPAVKTQAYSINEHLTQSTGPVISSGQVFSQEHPPLVNMPVLDKPGMADELISVNFEQVDIRTVLKTIGDITGINFVVDDNVRGTVTLMSPTKIRLGDLYEYLESILEVHGYAAVPSENLVKIVPRADAVKRNLQVRVGSNPSEIPNSDSIITQIIPLSYAEASEVSQIVQPLLADGSQMATYPKTNSIVITDTCSNIRHIVTIIQKLDVTGSQEQVTVFGLEYASAQILGEHITRIMEKHKSVSSQTVRSRNTPQIETEIKILPDIRTNSLIVVANAQDTETIDGLIMQLDIQRPMGTNNVHVVYLKNGQAEDLAKSLTSALSNLKIAGVLEATQQIQVTADEGTNALIIAASAQDYEVIAEIIDKLDIFREQVFVEMLIMEVSEQGLKKIGVDWATLDQAVDGSTRGFGVTNFGPRVDFVSGTLEGLAVGLWRGSGSDVRIGTILHALEKQSGFNILSTPHIMTSNNHKAKIIVGENIPFVMQSKITENTDPITPTVIKTYEYKDVGITMEITPHISQGGLVRLDIISEFTKLIEDVTNISVDTPSTAKRQAETVISMKSGSTAVIGGLIRDDKITVQKKVPLLADIPVIGGLFKFTKDQVQKTNLMIFITPYVVDNQEDSEQIAEEKKQEIEGVLKDYEQKIGQH